jgi:hypothetical protein
MHNGRWSATIHKHSHNNKYATVIEDTYAGAIHGDATYNRRIRSLYNGNWLEFEWENPPMELGVEYRTTERYNGKPVYSKIVSCGDLPNASMKSVVHVAEVERILRVNGHTFGGSVMTIPYQRDSSIINISATHDNIEIYTNFDASANQCLAQIWYLKSNG